jgi:pimeloyl-ACP methyl ester carboxylesterase
VTWTPKQLVEGGAAERLGHYDRGATPYFASRMDPRLSYCLYVPKDYEQDGTDTYDLAVIVHGTARWAETYRNEFAALAEETRTIILAPLFPAGMTAAKELSGYKFMRRGGISYDLVTLDMVDEVAARYRLRSDRFLLHGFSGGGHFAHRFLYLHPERLMGVSIGAPGIVTLLDFDHDYWVGVRNFRDIFGKDIDLDAMRRVYVHMVIGAEDTETWEITLRPTDALWMDGAERLAAANRLDRMAALRDSYDAHGIGVQHDIVPGAGHDGRLMLEPVRAWFRSAMRTERIDV